MECFAIDKLSVQSPFFLCKLLGFHTHRLNFIFQYFQA